MIRFIYRGNSYSEPREKIVENIINIARKFIELPEQIEIEFLDLSPAVYGETVLDYRFRNRIRLNENLNTKDIIIPLIHELLHLNQVVCGYLSAKRNGAYVWKKKIYSLGQNYSYNEYKSLPWEMDVAQKQQKLLEKVLEGLDGNTKTL